MWYKMPQSASSYILPADYALAADSEFAGGQEHRTAIRVRPDYRWVGVDVRI